MPPLLAAVSRAGTTSDRPRLIRGNWRLMGVFIRSKRINPISEANGSFTRNRVGNRVYPKYEYLWNRRPNHILALSMSDFAPVGQTWICQYHWQWHYLDFSAWLILYNFRHKTRNSILNKVRVFEHCTLNGWRGGKQIKNTPPGLQKLAPEGKGLNLFFCSTSSSPKSQIFWLWPDRWHLQWPRICFTIPFLEVHIRAIEWRLLGRGNPPSRLRNLPIECVS